MDNSELGHFIDPILWGEKWENGKFDRERLKAYISTEQVIGNTQSVKIEEKTLPPARTTVVLFMARGLTDGERELIGRGLSES